MEQVALRLVDVGDLVCDQPVAIRVPRPVMPPREENVRAGRHRQRAAVGRVCVRGAVGVDPGHGSGVHADERREPGPQ